MNIKTILFDLDGTLLPMDQNVFVEAYFSGLVNKAVTHGYKQEEFIKTVWGGIGAMIKNNGNENNESVFWKFFVSVYGKESVKDIAVFNDFYKNEFQQVRAVCGFNPEVKSCIEQAKEMGYRIALATNPVFPAIAIKSRICWSGLAPDDFEYCTTYENSCRCKPNLDYYRNILKELNVSADECLMVGNDVDEDMVAENLGMQVFLITDCLINRNNKDISAYHRGNFSDFIEYLKGLRYETNKVK